MFTILFALPVLMSLCVARPQTPQSAAPPAAAGLASRGGESTPIPIVSQTEENNPDGSFQFSYETGNGIKVEEKGYQKDGSNSSEKIQVIEGSVTYTDVDGTVVNLKYIADENGYQPQGDHIPKNPDSQTQAGQPGAVQSDARFAAQSHPGQFPATEQPTA